MYKSKHTGFVLTYCRFCEVTFRLESKLYWQFTENHLKNCPAFLERVAAFIAENGVNVWVRKRIVIMQAAFNSTAIMHKDKGEKATRCDSRCINAKRGDCDCKCNGANHGGANRTWAA
jgi:hypothetical protein